jgi:hypothetical protein
MFELDGQQFDLATVEGWAKEDNKTLDQYVNIYGIKDLRGGKTTPTTPGAVVEETVAPKLKGLAFKSVTSLPEYPGAKLEYINPLTDPEADKFEIIKNRYFINTADPLKGAEAFEKEKAQKEYIEKLPFHFKQSRVKKEERAAYDKWKETGVIDESLLPQQEIPTINPKTLKPYTGLEIVENVIDNFKPSMLMQWEGIKFGAIDWAKNVFGKDVADFLFAYDPELIDSKIIKQEDKYFYEKPSGELEEIGGRANEKQIEVLEDYIKLQNTLEYAGSITEGFANGNVAVTVGGMANAISGAVQTIVPALVTRGASLYPQMAGTMIADFNLEKANALYKNDPNAIEKLIKNNQTEFAIPATAATIAASFEYIGFKGITKALQANKGIASNTLKLLWATGTEGATGWGQFLVEDVNQLLAKGTSLTDALAKTATKAFSQEALESTLQEAFGGFGISIGGKALKSLSSVRAATYQDYEKDIDELYKIRLKIKETSDEDILNALNEKAKAIESKIASSIIEANSIFSFGSEKDLNEINSLSELRDKQVKRVNELNNKKNKGEISEEDYLLVYETYKETFLDAKNRINGIVGKISENANKTAQEAEKIYQQKGVEGEADILNLYKPMAEKMANKYRNVPGFEKQLLVDEILTGKRGIFDLIRSYKAEENPGVTLPMYVNKFAQRRAIEAAQRILKTDFELDVTEAKGVTDTVTAETQIETKQEAQQEIKKALAEDLNLSENTQNEIVAAVEKTLGTKLPAVTDKKFKQTLTTGFRNELTNTFKSIFGRTAAYEQFLRDNFEKIYPAIPQETINKKFKEFNEPVLDKDGKQLRERTAEGKKVFKKKDISKAEFIKYFLNAPGNVKGARKTSLAEVMADEIGLDNVLTSLSKPEVVEKFKTIQEIQGQEVPSNFIEIISEKIDRAINYLDGLQKNNGILYSSLVIPELSIAAVKTFLKAAKAALKATNSFAKAVKAGIEAAQELFETKEEKQAVANVLTENYKKAEDLGEKTIVDQVTEQTDRALQEIYIPKTVNNLINNLQESYTENALENIENIRRFILLHSKAIRTAASPSKFGKQIPNLTTNKELFKMLNIPKKLLGKKAFHLKKSGPGVSIYFGNEKISNPINLTQSSERNKVVKNPEGSIDKLNIQSDKYKDLLINEIVRLKNIDKQLAKDMLKVMQLDQQSALRLSGKIGIIFNKGETTNEHNPPIQSIIEKIEDFIDDKISLDIIKNELNNSRQNLVSKEFDKSIPKELKAKASATRYKKAKEKFKGQYKEYNLPASKKSLDRQFNEDILQKSTGVKFTKEFSPVEARILGKGKGRNKFFIPYSADDFVGLLYATLAGGKTGDQQMEWYRENLLRPFSRGIQQYEAAKQNALREWQILKKEAKKNVPGGLTKKNATGLSNQDAVRIYIWNQQSMEIPDTKGSQALINENIKIVRKNKELKAFAEKLMALNPEGYPEPSKNWDSGDITTDLVSYINGVKRSEFLNEWKENADIIFSDKNKEKLRALYGDRYVEALDDILYRMRTGTNRKFGASRIEKQFMDWTNNSVGAIMFFNARSAVLQTLSAVNFINFTDNNPLNASLALMNQKQYWDDFSTLFNSDFLKQRRSGLQTDVNADEIARAAKGAENTARAALSAILKFGFTPTQIADSFAIASGGATFYRNRINKYKKEGLSQQEAEKKAFTDFQEIAEETQQSARPDRISSQQASSLGRLILAFGNTPMQYARLTKKATLDLINGRGDWKTNMSKIMYYSVIQNIIFSALQQGLFALLFDDEDDDKEKSRLFRIGNSSLDTLLRGSGVYGAAAATVKNMILEIIDQQKSGRPDYTEVVISATAISPPINSKLRKLNSAGKTFTYKQSKEKVFTEGFSLENPALLATGQIISAATNLPADRVVLKADHLKTAMEPETELWQAIALSLGWSEWDLNMIEKQTKKQSIKKPVKIQTGLKKNKIKVGIK